MKNFLRYIACCLLLLISSCQSVVEEVGDGVSLSLRLATSQLTRGAVTDNPSAPSMWSQAERAVDGRFLYNISVYIVDNNGQIVARQENISVDGQVAETVVEFDHTYNIKRGIYTIMAVANNKSYTVDNTTLQSGLLGDWSAQSYESLMGNQIAGSSDNISPKSVIQPLSMLKQVELHAGSNMVEGELVRTFARLRIEVKNNSGSLPLKINSLSFSSNFAQKKAYVFDDGTDRKYFGEKGAPRSTSDAALQPFVGDNSGAKTINAQTSAVVFDSYLLESKAASGQTYQYTLDMSYDYTATITTYSKSNESAVTSVGNITSGEYYLIQNQSGDKLYLSSGEDKVETASLSNNDLKSVRTSSVWVVTKNNKNFYLQNLESGLYMQAPTNNSVPLGNNAVAFTDDYSNSYLSMKSSNRYIGVDDNGNVVGYRDSGTSRRFYFYKVTKSENTSAGQIKYDTPIVLTSIDPVSQQSTNVTAIKRNDFINVLITVSYNPQSGEFDFYVEDWNTGGGEVEFN